MKHIFDFSKFINEAISPDKNFIWPNNVDDMRIYFDWKNDGSILTILIGDKGQKMYPDLQTFKIKGVELEGQLIAKLVGVTPSQEAWENIIKGEGLEYTTEPVPKPLH